MVCRILNETEGLLAAGVRFFKVYLCHATLSRKMYSGLLRLLSTLSCKTLTITHVAHFSAGKVYNPFSSSLFIKANGYKSAGMQVCRSAGLQVCKSASLQVCKSASLQVCKSASLQVCKSASLQVCKSASLQVCKSASLHVCKSASLQSASVAHRDDRGDRTN